MAAFPATGGHAPPRRRRAPRPAGWTLDKRAAFLSALGTSLNVRRAADNVGLSASAAYQLRRRDPEFARDWGEALDEGYANLEFEMLRQAIEGCETRQTVIDGADGSVKQVRITHRHPHMVQLWLMQAHREAVEAARAAQAQQRYHDDDDDDIAARVRAHMILVRKRLLGEDDGSLHGGPDADGREADGPDPDGPDPDGSHDRG